jgi:hypothetical protein
LSETVASDEPPRIVKSSTSSDTLRPPIRAVPITALAGLTFFSLHSASYSDFPVSMPISNQEPGSTSFSTRSRAV